MARFDVLMSWEELRINCHARQHRRRFPCDRSGEFQVAHKIQGAWNVVVTKLCPHRSHTAHNDTKAICRKWPLPKRPYVCTHAKNINLSQPQVTLVLAVTTIPKTKISITPHFFWHPRLGAFAPRTCPAWPTITQSTCTIMFHDATCMSSGHVALLNDMSRRHRMPFCQQASIMDRQTFTQLKRL